MELSEYLEHVAGRNATEARAHAGDLRMTINAIMTLDGFFGSLHAEFHRQAVISEPSDDKWKDELARDNKSYRLLRDCAHALKHGQLDPQRKSRLVLRPDQIMTMPTSFDTATFDRSAFDTETVWIEANDTDYRAAEVIGIVLDLARRSLSELTEKSDSGSQKTGSVAAKPSGGSTSRLEEQAEFLLALIAAQPDLTLDEVVVVMENQGRDCRAAEIQRFAENAPR